MRTAVDTSVLLDLLSSHPTVAQRSDRSLQEAADQGELVVCEIVLAELGPALRSQPVSEFAQDWGLTFVPATLEVADLAARHFAKYLSRGGKRGRIVADFLIGAHAMLMADRLLTSDLGFRRDYFTNLKWRYPD